MTRLYKMIQAALDVWEDITVSPRQGTKPFRPDWPLTAEEL